MLLKTKLYINMERLRHGQKKKVQRQIMISVYKQKSKDKQHFIKNKWWTQGLWMSKQFLLHMCQVMCGLLSFGVPIIIRLSHFNLLIWNHWVKLNQILLGWSLYISDGAHLISKMIVILNKFLKNPKNFLAHLAKGNVSFGHHLASVVR